MQVYKSEFPVINGMQNRKWWSVETVANSSKWLDRRWRMHVVQSQYVSVATMLDGSLLNADVVTVGLTCRRWRGWQHTTDFVGR